MSFRGETIGRMYSIIMIGLMQANIGEGTRSGTVLQVADKEICCGHTNR